MGRQTNSMCSLRALDATRKSRSLSAAVILFFCTATLGDAATLTFNITNPTATAPIGGTAVFAGTITNGTGVGLNTTDIFVNAFGFDPTATLVNQLLGAPDLSIPNGATSPLLDIFSVTIAPNAQIGTPYSVSVFLQDVNDNFTPPIDVTITPTASTVPEPSTAVLLSVGAFSFLLLDLRKRFR